MKVGSTFLWTKLQLHQVILKFCRLWSKKNFSLPLTTTKHSLRTTGLTSKTIKCIPTTSSNSINKEQSVPIKQNIYLSWNYTIGHKYSWLSWTSDFMNFSIDKSAVLKCFECFTLHWIIDNRFLIALIFIYFLVDFFLCVRGWTIKNTNFFFIYTIRHGKEK